MTRDVTHENFDFASAYNCMRLGGTVRRKSWSERETWKFDSDRTAFVVYYDDKLHAYVYNVSIKDIIATDWVLVVR